MTAALLATLSTAPVEVRPATLLVAGAMMLGIAALMRWQRVGIEREVAFGAARSFVQLFAIGFVLQYIFQSEVWWICVGTLALMFCFAVVIIVRRERTTRLRRFWLLAATAMFAGVACTSGPVWLFILDVKPWWHPRYFIMINSMCLAFCMNGVALTVERFITDLRLQKDQVELALSLGATPRQAVHEVYRKAVAGPMIPALNMLAAVGVVQLPGFMTGQITGGAEPHQAVLYQILILFMMVISRALSILVFTHMAYSQFFTDRLQLRHDMLG